MATASLELNQFDNAREEVAMNSPLHFGFIDSSTSNIW